MTRARFVVRLGFMDQESAKLTSYFYHPHFPVRCDALPLEPIIKARVVFSQACEQWIVAIESVGLLCNNKG